MPQHPNTYIVGLPTIEVEANSEAEAMQKFLAHYGVEATSLAGAAGVESYIELPGDDHPVYPEVEWNRAVRLGETLLGYWEWVHVQTERDAIRRMGVTPKTELFSRLLDAQNDEDLCDECQDPLDDGEGWNGLCGNCADRRERRGLN